MDILFATSNEHKIIEMAAMLPSAIILKGLAEFNVTGEIPETGATFSENALQKARHVQQKTGYSSIMSDDSGLVVDALGGEPGVYSARYAGVNAGSDANILKLLHNLEGVSNRKARFVCIIALIINGSEFLFEGVSEGEITERRSGQGGFGYDPVFRPVGFNKTYSELTSGEKNSVSHRGIAAGKLSAFLLQK